MPEPWRIDEIARAEEQAFLDSEYDYWADDHPDDSDDRFEGLQ